MMPAAARVLGDQAGSTAPVFRTFLAVHVAAGLTAVLTGAIAAFARKGSPRHIRAGRMFYRAITIVFLTATALSIMRWRQDYQLLIIGAVAFAAATTGYLHRRRHRPGDSGHILGMGIGYAAMLTAFYVDNGPHLPLWDRLPPLAFWFLPGLAGAPIIARAVLAARRRTSPADPPAIRRSAGARRDAQTAAEWTVPDAARSRGGTRGDSGKDRRHRPGS